MSKTLTIATNISQKDGFALLDYWTVGLGKKGYKQVNTWATWGKYFSDRKYKAVKWLYRHNGRMDIWLSEN